MKGRRSRENIKRRSTVRGISLIDVVVGTFIMLTVFLGLFGAFRISVELVLSTKAKTGAVSLMTEKMETIRSLAYSDVGTVGGIPAGNLPQVEQVTLNGISYTINTLIQYEDAPQDGLDAADENSITADYKVVKVEVFWNVKDSSRSTFAVTRIAPVGIETLTGGGTLTINVFDAAAQPIQGADVRIVNNTTTTTIDTTVQTNANGQVSFPGAPEAANYEITTTKSGYSTAGTYAASSTNPSPSPGHVSVAEETTTTVGFGIDVLGTLRVFTFSPPGEGAFVDTFTDATKITGITSVVVSGGALILDENPQTGFPSSGSAFSNPVSPSFLSVWKEATFNASTTGETSFTLRAYYNNGSAYVLVPDEDLPQNSTGFTTSPVDLSGLSTATYNSLQLGAFLGTTNSSSTPQLHDWELSYVAGPTPLGGVTFLAHGAKAIGSLEGGGLVRKFSTTETTTQFGEWFFTDREWDTYTVTIATTSQYALAERCPNTVTLAPGATLDLSLWAALRTSHSLRTIVESGGVPLSGATVSLSGPSAHNADSSTCGQAFFSDLQDASYTVSVTHPGYQQYSEPVTVSGETELVISMTAL